MHTVVSDPNTRQKYQIYTEGDPKTTRVYRLEDYDYCRLDGMIPIDRKDYPRTVREKLGQLED